MAQPSNTNVGRSIYLDTTSATTALKKLTAESELLKQSIDRGEKAGKDMSQEIAKMGELGTKIKQVQDVLDKGLSPSLREQEKIVRKLRLELRGMSADAEGFDKKRKAYAAAVSDLENMRSKVSGLAQANNGLGGSFLNFAKNLAGFAAATLSVQALTGFLQGAVDEANQAEQAVSRLRNTLNNIGRDDAFDRLTLKAEELAQTFQFLDNDDITGVFEQLIRYGKLTERQIGDLTPVIIDFAKKQSISVEESASVMIKALEGNAKALKEYGINIKDGSDVTERFGILMSDLKPKVDGAAEAFGNTFAGQLAIARQELKNAQEEIGNGLIPMLAKLARAAADSIKGVMQASGFIKNVFSKGALGAFVQNNVEQRADGERDAENRGVESLIAAYRTTRGANGQTVQRTAKQVLDILNRDMQTDLTNLAVKQVTQDAAGEALVQSSIARTRMAIAKLQDELNADQDKVLGSGGAGKDGKTSAGESIDTLRDKYNALVTALNDASKRLNMTPMQLELDRISQELDKQITEIGKLLGKGAITSAEASTAIALAKQVADEKAKEALKNNTQKTFSAEEIRRFLKESEPQLKSLGNAPMSFGEFQSRDIIAGLQNTATTASSARARRDAQIKLLEEEQRRELASKEFTENEKIAIEIKYAQKRAAINQDWRDILIAEIDKYTGYANAAFNVLNTLAQARNNAENQALQRDIANNDRRKRMLLANAKSGLETEQETRIQIMKMDQEIDDKKRQMEAAQFERSRKIQIAQTLMNAASAQVQLWLKPGWPAAIPMAAILAAQTIAQIAVINSQKPQFERGGILPGPSHREGGLPVMNPKTGQAVAEVEGGELILSRRFVQNNPSLVPSLLHASASGQRMLMFLDRPYQSINYSAISTGGRRKYADGGILDTQSTTSVQVAQSNARMEMLLEALITKLDQPSVAIISQKKIEDAAITKSRILDEAIFR